MVGPKNIVVGGHASRVHGGIRPGQPIDLRLPVTWSTGITSRALTAFMFRVIARRKLSTSERVAQANVQLFASQWSTDVKFDTPARVELTSASGGLNMLRRRFARPLDVDGSRDASAALRGSERREPAAGPRVEAPPRDHDPAFDRRWRGRLIRQLLTKLRPCDSRRCPRTVLAPVAARSLVRFLSPRWAQ